MEMVTQIREDIQKLKVENVAHEFTLWEITDCDELYDFKYYFPKSNPSHLDHKYSHLKNSKNYKRKLLKKISWSWFVFPIIKIMDETLGSERFTFGDVQDTEYVAYDIIDTEVKLPYNPFVFDFKLNIFKSKPNYE